MQKQTSRPIEPIEPIKPIAPLNYSITESVPRSGWIWKMGAIAALIAAGGVAWYFLPKFRVASPPVVKAPAPAAKPNGRGVAALGRLEPKGEITRLSSSGGVEGVRVAQLLVQEGDRVRTGQIIVILSSYQTRQATLMQAQSKVSIAKARLAQVQAGAKRGAVNAQRSLIGERRAKIARFEATLQNAETELQRYSQLLADGAITASELDTRQLNRDTAAQDLERAMQEFQQEANTLDSVQEVRLVDVQEAEAQIQSAIAAVGEAQADLELSLVRSPLNGQVLKVHTRAGEVIGSNGIAEIAQTSQMYAVSQVYETDIGRVYQGQEAIVTTDILPGVKMKGVVDQIGLKVLQQDAFSTNTNAETDRKVVEVKVLLNAEDSRKVAKLTNLQVQVIFKK
jgi:HlyD family secretion protein